MTESKVIQLRKKLKILLIGDNCLDVYQYGSVDRISPEAPVPVFKFMYEEAKPGMAGNVEENLKTFGCNVVYYHGGTSTKTRLIDLKSRQQIVRIDEDWPCSPIEFDYKDTFKQYDAIVISDYNKGSVTYDLIETLRKKFDGPIFLDTKKQDLAKFDGVYIKINEAEYKNLHTINDKLIATLGANGAMYNRKVFPAPKVEVVDVTGAGDTFLAALAYKFLIKSDIEEAIKFAIQASSITVQHMGVYAPKLEEICV